MEWKYWVPPIAVACVAALLCRELYAEIERQKKMRQTERQGRIKAETSVHREEGSCDSLTVFPIGYVKSVFTKRNGTPRQPGLVVSAESSIELVPALHTAIVGMDAFSHIWIMFEFSGNTNKGKRVKSAARGKPFDGLKLLVEPPKARGRKVGVLSCRTPHRPNPIGLSLCRLVRVEPDRVIVSGLDCLDGTPIIDIKPYLPQIESLSNAIVPEWIYQGIDKDKALVVTWADSVVLKDEQMRSVITQTLSSDIRSKNQSNTSEWHLCIGEFEIEYSIDDNIVTILKIS